MSALLLLKILSPNLIHQNLPPRSSSSSLLCQWSPVSSTSCQAPSPPPLSSLLFHFVHALPRFSPPVREGFSVRFPPSVSLPASSSLLPLPAPNDFSPLSDLSPFSPLLLLWSLVYYSSVLRWFFRQLVLLLHPFSSSCATALSMQPVSPSLMRMPVSLRANSHHPSPPSVRLLLLPSHTSTVQWETALCMYVRFVCSRKKLLDMGSQLVIELSVFFSFFFSFLLSKWILEIYMNKKVRLL